MAPAIATCRTRRTCCESSSGESTDEPTIERIVVLECEIDDMNPQLFGLVMDRLYAAGALEVYFASVQMKKNRPGTLLTILGGPNIARS